MSNPLKTITITLKDTEDGGCLIAGDGTTELQNLDFDTLSEEDIEKLTTAERYALIAIATMRRVAHQAEADLDDFISESDVDEPPTVH